MDTLLTHTGRGEDPRSGMVNPGVDRASTVLFPTLDALEAARPSYHELFYGRYGTPTTFAFEEALAALEGGERTLALPSGLAAIAFPLLALVSAGDHILVADNVYGPTRRFCEDILRRFSVTVDYFDPMAPAALVALFRPETRAVFLEAPGSLTFEVPDVAAMADIARRHGAVTLFDNTWAAGYFYQPLQHGIDISLQAATKYIVGHSDAMMGGATSNIRYHEILSRTVWRFGPQVAPDATYLALRGLRSMGARLKQHQDTGLALAHWLDSRPEVAEVRHPALPSCPGHRNWLRDFSGACGLFSIVLHPVTRADLAAMLDGLELFGMGYSWGGFESLILPVTPGAERTATQWTAPGPVLRIHAGLEAADDLIEDLTAGLRRLRAER